MNEFQQWCATQTWTASVREMLTKLSNKTESYVVAYDRPGCHRTSNAVDRPMNRLCRLLTNRACTAIKARPSYGWGLGLAAELSPLMPRGETILAPTTVPFIDSTANATMNIGSTT